jgi:hypothetical protein
MGSDEKLINVDFCKPDHPQEDVKFEFIL